jgi:E3 ubiquitin-protein ligase SHPRH
VNRLVRQIRFWRTQEPAVKHIIFSSWKDALTIVETALRDNRIRYLCRTGKKNDDSAERFNQDPSIQVYLLHGEKENSGLTINSASVCHLLEPVINSGFEMQGRGLGEP